MVRVKKLTIRQIKDLITAYKRFTEEKLKFGGLKTGWALERKRLVKLADYQFDDWTMWIITEEGIKLAESLGTKNS